MVRRITLKRTARGVDAELPQEMVERLAIGDHDELTAVETDRGILLTARGKDIEDTMRLFERVRQKYDRTFQQLAK
jgi:hypothetical protein